MAYGYQPLLQRKFGYGKEQINSVLCIKSEGACPQSNADVQLSLAQICERLGVSNSYFSTVFKKETGKSFVSYVTDYRMEQAARLLIETNEKSYVIAQKVGYTDPNYFSYVFKRKFGVSPSKYRAEHIKSEKQVFEK